MDTRLSQEDLWTLRGLVQKAGWGEFMRHVGLLMAEQKCGVFDYRRHQLVPEEFRPLLERYPPPGG